MTFGEAKADKMTDFDAEVMEALKELSQRPPLTISVPPLLAFFLISQIQLALRHPRNTGPSRNQVARFLNELRGLVTAPGDTLDTLITMGWDERFDRD